VKKRDLLALEDWSPEDYDRLLALVARVKRGELAGGLTGKVLAQIFLERDPRTDRKSTRLNSSHTLESRMPSSA